MYYGVAPTRTTNPSHPSRKWMRTTQIPPTSLERGVLSMCLDFLPDFVCDIRDFWMLDFAERSPFRPYFKWVVMPTVDARPQARQWVATYAGADACLTYSDQQEVFYKISLAVKLTTWVAHRPLLIQHTHQFQTSST